MICLFLEKIKNEAAEPLKQFSGSSRLMVVSKTLMCALIPSWAEKMTAIQWKIHNKSN